MSLGSFEKMLKGLYPNDSDPKILCDHTYNEAKNQDKILIKVCRSDFNDIINIVFKNDKLTNKSINNIKPYYTNEEFTDSYLDNKFDILKNIQHQYENDFDNLLGYFEESKDTKYIKDLEELINKMILLTIRYRGFKLPMHYLFKIVNKKHIDVDFDSMWNISIMETLINEYNNNEDFWFEDFFDENNNLVYTDRESLDRIIRVLGINWRPRNEEEFHRYFPNNTYDPDDSWPLETLFINSLTEVEYNRYFPNNRNENHNDDDFLDELLREI